MGPGLLNKYIWLIQKIISAGSKGTTLKEITSAWKNKFGEDYPRKTFNNHKQAIADVFDISIECNRSSNRYYIKNGDDILDGESGKSWLIDTFTVSNILSIAKERLSGRVSVEEIPSGKKFLTTLMEAMQDNHIIQITYGRYGETPGKRNVRPYAVKEDSRRWYLVGFDMKREALRVFALDRISEIHILDETFKMPEGFDIDELFATSFGIYLPDGPGVSITFKTYGKESMYIRDLPIHRSQKEIETNEDSSTFKIFASPNTSLYLEFLRHGPNLEVLSPTDVRNKISEMTAIMYGRYNKSGIAHHKESNTTQRKKAKVK